MKKHLFVSKDNKLITKYGEYALRFMIYWHFV